MKVQKIKLTLKKGMSPVMTLFRTNIRPAQNLNKKESKYFNSLLIKFVPTHLPKQKLNMLSHKELWTKTMSY